MSKKVKLSLIVIILLIILGMIFYPKLKMYFSSGEDPADGARSGALGGGGGQNRALNVNAQVVKYSDLEDIIRITGFLLPDEEVDLSFESSGKITNIFFKEGSNVKKGQLLAKINDKPLQAELQKLEAQLPLARDRVFRQRSLLAKDAVSQEAYESVNTELDKLMADVELVKARIAQTELRAPFDGIIGLRQVSEGAYASPTVIISKLTKIMPLKVEFTVQEAYANQIQNGTVLNFTVKGDDSSHRASVYAVESKLDETALSLRARALYTNPGGRIKPGQAATIEIILNDTQNAIVVPSLSVKTELGRDIIYVYKNGTAQQVIVEKGMRTSSDIQIVKGLNIGDTLLVSGVMQLRDGMPVTIDRYID